MDVTDAKDDYPTPTIKYGDFQLEKESLRLRLDFKLEFD